MNWGFDLLNAVVDRFAADRGVLVKRRLRGSDPVFNNTTGAGGTCLHAVVKVDGKASRDCVVQGLW
jgi:hypothetical protein